MEEKNEIVKGNPEVDKVTEEKWQGLSIALGEVTEGLKTAIEACNVLREDGSFDKDVLNGYYNTAREIKANIIAAAKQISEKESESDEGILVLDYVSILSEVNSVETLTAALNVDVMSDVVTSDIMANSGEQSIDIKELEKLGIELMEAQKGEDNGKV